MNDTIVKRLTALRSAMHEKGLDAVIIPHADPHQSEYLAEHWQARPYFSGFTGSAGDLVVTASKAALWTDSRYFLQAAQQLVGTGIELMKSGIKDTPSINEWLVSELLLGSRVGLDGRLFTISTVDDLIDDLEGIATIDTRCRIIEDVWEGRKPLPAGKAFIYEERYAGESAESKLARICAALASKSMEALWISALDEIAWTLNLRGRDVECNPVNICYLYVSERQTVLFVEETKITPDVALYLKECNVKVMPYSGVKEFIGSLPSSQSVLVDEDTTSFSIAEALGERRCVLGTSPVPMLKAVKNETQIAGFRDAMRRDGVALVNGFMEIEKRMAANEKVTETDVAEILHRHRALQPLFFDESFATIAGYGSHGAIVHYEATLETDVQLQPKGLLLVDSGAQYLDGTTDITRTIALGKPTPEEKRDFTLVLKGMIAMAMAVFPEGTRGIQVDALAHQYLWRAGWNYLHGTGHGIGHFLNVHEGPFSVRNNGRNWNVALLPGMVTSDEPGLYKEGRHGIRCENLLLIVEAEIEGGDGSAYLAFETLTLFPFDIELIDMTLMNRDEIEWLNAYHRRVHAELSPLLDADAKAWLAIKCREIANK